MIFKQFLDPVSNTLTYILAKSQGEFFPSLTYIKA